MTIGTAEVSLIPMNQPHDPEKAAENDNKKQESVDHQDSNLGSIKMSKEEQMAQFEEQLKEEDWGHQPC